MRSISPKRLAHPMTTIITLCFAAWIHHFRGARKAARESAERLIGLADAHGSPTYTSEGAAVLAYLQVLEHCDRASVAELHRTLTTIQARRTAWRNVASFCLLAEAAAHADDVATGLDALALISEEYRGAFFAPEIRRIHGELLLQSGKPDDAERCFRSAIEIAARRAERSLELRAATSLARLLMGKGRRGEARRILGGIYAWFTEGLDTADLGAARALLEDLKVA
jgi:tetratricopeptide (TPR) repeat protein